MKNYFKNTSPLELIIGFFAFIFSITGVIILFVFVIQLSKDYQAFGTNDILLDKTGQVGDFIGGLVGSVWAFAGVLLFFLALTIQRKEIKINRDALKVQIETLEQQIEEFKLQRIEQEETRKVFEQQNKTQKLQQFESTFFNLLGLHNQIVNSIDLVQESPFKKDPRKPWGIAGNTRTEKETISGRDCFELFCKRFRHFYDETVKEENKPGGILFHEDPLQIDINIVESAYNKFYVLNQSDIGHYFRGLYHIIKLVNDSEIENKKRYTNLVRAQLSTYELLLLFYDGISRYGTRFKPLIEDYSLLKNLPDTEMNTELNHNRFYDPKAFK